MFKSDSRLTFKSMWANRHIGGSIFNNIQYPDNKNAGKYIQVPNDLKHNLEKLSYNDNGADQQKKDFWYTKVKNINVNGTDIFMDVKLLITKNNLDMMD